MAVREYIGARYIPIFATDAEWSSANTYEPLTVVTYEGCSYVSRQYVPAGIDLDNGDYWVLWADFNAQVEAYREEVQAFDGRIDALEDGLPVSDFDENTTVKDAIDGVKALLPASDFASDATVKDAIDGIGALLPTTAFDSTNTVDARFDVIEADSWVTTTRIADDAITADKIADNAIASSNIVSNAITSEKLADSAVTTSKIADNSVTKDKIANEDILLIFGDSWCEANLYQDWITPLNKILNCGEVLNYGVGGASFAYNSGNSVSTQVALANSELTQTQKNNVKYVIVMAGVNDHHPRAAAGVLDAIDNVMKTCKADFPNALIQWFPTSCAPSYDNSNGPKWLFCNSTFWTYISKKIGASGSNDDANRYCFPSCGIAFYLCQDSPVSAFFDNSKLHLSAYGKNAIVPAILEGFGLMNIPYYVGYSFTKGTDRVVSVSLTPIDIRLHGQYSEFTDSQFNEAIGNRILVSMSARLALRLYNGANVEFFVFGSTDGSASAIDYCTVAPTDSYTGATFSPRGGQSGVRYILG